MKKFASLIAALSASALVLAGCSTGGEKNATESSEAQASSSAPASSAAEESAQAVTLDDGFVRAKDAESDMTAVFGTLTNHTDKDVVVVEWSSSLGEADYQLHEVVDGTMRETEGGFTVPAGGTHVLKQGGDHLMIMGLPDPIEAGDTVTISLKLDDGSTVEDIEVPVRSSLAGGESYGDIDAGDDASESAEADEHTGHGHDGHAGQHDHDDHADHGHGDH